MNNDKHICFFISSFKNKGGTERITASLINELSNYYKISIISLSDNEYSSFELGESVSKYSIFNNKENRRNKVFQYFYTVNKLKTIVKKEKVNYLINVDVILSLYSIPLKFISRNLKIISWEHFNCKINLGVKSRDLGRFLSAKYADLIITLTEQDKEFYLEKYGSINIKVIPNFISILPPVSDRANIEKKTVLAVGRFTYQKGFDQLIDIWSMIKKDSKSEGWVLKIVGNGDDKEKIKIKISELCLDYSIQVFDATSHVIEFYKNASIFIMTSRFEGLPMVLLEAKSHGLPIVSYDCITGPREIIRNGEDGYLIPYNEPKLMVENIIKLMRDKELRQQFSDQAYINSKEFLFQEFFPQWMDLFK